MIAFLHMTKYFAMAYKTGSYPQISQDVIYLWARPHPKAAEAPDPVGKPKNYELVCTSLVTQSEAISLTFLMTTTTTGPRRPVCSASHYRRCGAHSVYFSWRKEIQSFRWILSIFSPAIAW